MNEFVCEISDTPKNEDSFAVMFLPVPDFPDDGPVDDIVRPVMKAVIAARKGFETDKGVFQEGWSFVSLDTEEKSCIGDAMVSLSIPDHEWKWCNLYNE